MRCVPKINGIYWLCLGLGSVVGANAGDFLSDAHGLGYLGGLPFLAAGLIAVFLAERFMKYVSAAYFWAAVIILIAAASDIADALHDFHISLAAAPVMCLLLAFMVIVWRSQAPANEEQAFIPVGRYYWITLLVAGTLGAVAGDAASYPLGFGFLGATVVSAIPLAFLLVIGRNGLYPDVGFHWLVVVFIVSAGTAIGGLLIDSLHSIDLSTALSGIVFVALIVVAYEMRKGNKRLQVQTFGEAAE